MHTPDDNPAQDPETEGVIPSDLGDDQTNTDTNADDSAEVHDAEASSDEGASDEHVDASDDDDVDTVISEPEAENALNRAPSGLGDALRAHGFTALTPIQSAVVDSVQAGRDLRITSQTGSGKTVAVGLAIAEIVEHAHDAQGVAKPAALVIAPTRELAAQLAREFTWLYEPLGKHVAIVTGGASYTFEKRALSRGPHVLVGTPGRLLDHLNRGAVSLEALEVVVFDEADEMLDMGFEEDLNAILDHGPEERITHMVSATFSRDAVKLANRLQHNALPIEGTPLGAANTDIEHRVILAPIRDQVDVIVNLLLRFLGDKTLIFVRTRARTAELASDLSDLGFKALPLSGEMSQRERVDTYRRFRKGIINVLVATDVAARGLDVHDISQVIQADIPQDSEVFTHRSGRTGRAGREGRNIVLVPPRAQKRAASILRHAKVKADFVDAPSVESIEKASLARLEKELLEKVDTTDRIQEVAARLLTGRNPAEVVEHLLTRINFDGPTTPREIRSSKDKKKNDRLKHPRNDSGEFVAFQASWGSNAGANPKRVLAVVCRRGDITRDAIGKIRVGPTSSMVEVRADQADAFEAAMKKPDSRDGHVRVRRWKAAEDVARGGFKRGRKEGKRGGFGGKKKFGGGKFKGKGDSKAWNKKPKRKGEKKR